MGALGVYSAANGNPSQQRLDRLANERQRNKLSVLRRAAAAEVRQLGFLVYRDFKLERTKSLVCKLQGQAFPLFVVAPVDPLDGLSSEILAVVGTPQLTHRRRQSGVPVMSPADSKTSSNSVVVTLCQPCPASIGMVVHLSTNFGRSLSQRFSLSSMVNHPMPSISTAIRRLPMGSLSIISYSTRMLRTSSPFKQKRNSGSI